MSDKDREHYLGHSVLAPAGESSFPQRELKRRKGRKEEERDSSAHHAPSSLSLLIPSLLILTLIGRWQKVRFQSRSFYLPSLLLRSRKLDSLSSKETKLLTSTFSFPPSPPFLFSSHPEQNKDIHWYAKDGEETDAAATRRAEIKAIKEAEEDALAVALGFAPADRSAGGAGSGSNGIEVKKSEEQKEKEREEKIKRKA